MTQASNKWLCKASQINWFQVCAFWLPLSNKFSLWVCFLNFSFFFTVYLFYIDFIKSKFIYVEFTNFTKGLVWSLHSFIYCLPQKFVQRFFAFKNFPFQILLDQDISKIFRNGESIVMLKGKEMTKQIDCIKILVIR